MNSDIKVAVIMGGPSSEREISILSGRAVASALLSEGYCVTELVINKDIEPHIDLLKSQDVTFLALHGSYGEDGTLQARLEDLKITYTGSNSASSKNAMDKLISKRIFQAGGIETPKYIIEDGNFGGEIDTKLSALGLAPPLVVKPNSGGSSLGVKIVRDKPELKEAVMEARKFSDEVLIEEFIDGRELTVGILGDTPLEPIELSTTNEFYDYDAKYNSEETNYILPANLSPETREHVMALGLKAFNRLGCREFGRTDIMLTPTGRASVLEVNTIPGFTSHSLLPMGAKFANISFGELTSRIVKMALQRKDAN